MKASYHNSSTLFVHQMSEQTSSRSFRWSGKRTSPQRLAIAGLPGHGRHQATASTSANAASRDELIDSSWTQIFAYKLRYHYLLITLVTIASYWPSIWGELVFDDRPALIDNKDLRPNTPLYRLFLNDYWGQPLSEELSHKSYRPLTVLTFRGNFWFHGLNPIGYHAINLGLHSIVSILFYKLAALFVPEISLTTSLLFALHPVHTDAVASVVGRAELLSAFFYLSSLLIHLSKTSKYKPLLTICLSWLGFLCKEQCLTVLVVCAACDIAKALVASPHQPAPAHSSPVRAHTQLDSAWPAKARRVNHTRLPLLFLGFVAALLFRIWINGRGAGGGVGQLAPAFNRFDNPASVETGSTQLLTYAYLAAHHFKTLLFPFTLACDWTHGSLPLVTTLGQTQNVITAAFIAIVAALAIRARRNCQILILLTMTLVPFLPASNLFFTTGFVIAERILYLPSIGFVLLVAKGLQALLRRHAALAWLMQALLLLSFGLKTFQRCYDWQNEFALFSSGLRVNPTNIKLLNNVGRLMEKGANYSSAESYYTTALSVEPDSLRTYLNLGNLYVKMSNYTKAERVYRQAGALVEKEYFERRRASRLHVTALLRFAQLLSRDPSNDGEMRKIHELAILLTSDLAKGSRGDSGRSNVQFMPHHKAKAHPSHDQALDCNDLYNLAVMARQTGQVSEALRLLDEALALDPSHESSLIASARMIYDEGLTDQYRLAMRRLESVIRLGKGTDVVYFNLGMLAIRSEDYERGKRDLIKAIGLNGNFSEAIFNLALLYYSEHSVNQSMQTLRHLLHNVEPDHLSGYILLCDILVEHFYELRTAQACYKKVLALQPDNLEARRNVCVLRARESNPEAASFADLDSCLNGDTSSSDAMDGESSSTASAFEDQTNKSTIYLF